MTLYRCGAGAFACALVLLAEAPFTASYATWSDYGGSPDSMQYSALKQVNKTNVASLRQAWFYPTPGTTGRFAFTPLVLNGVMYVALKDSIDALDAATGKRIWTHPTEGQPTNRGISYWHSKDNSDQRLIFSANSYMQEINLRTGVTIPSFGNDGRVDLRESLGRNPKTIRNIQSNTPGRVFENLIIMGSSPGEGYGSPPGDLRAYDVISGKLVWTFHTIPHPGEFGYDTWPRDAWKYVGGANSWGEISIDEKRGIAYFALGAPTYDFYGGDRTGANLFGDSILALDARTGKRLWHYQLVHHDLWDYDPTTAPKLMTVRHNGKMVDIVAQPTKFGFLYVFDRVTGQPLWPIEERPVPKSTAPGEQSWPTQPFPTRPPPFARQTFTVNDINPFVDGAEKQRLKDLLAHARNEGVFTPPGLDDSIEVPGELGGSNWGGSAADPTTGMLYVRSIDLPALHKLTPASNERDMSGGNPAQQGHALFTKLCEGCHGLDRKGVLVPKEVGIERFKSIVRGGQGEMPPFSGLSERDLDSLAAYIDNPVATGALQSSGPEPGPTRYLGQYASFIYASNGQPAMGPPWTQLTAYDLNQGTIRWQIPMGTVPALAAKGIANTGAYRASKNGPVVTAGGLIFIGTGSDRSVHAYDKDTGKLLWETELEANPVGIPAVYEVGGPEFIALWAAAEQRSGPDAGSWKAGRPEAQGYYVFALP
jgi:quinoprotein glucose dehydrogenase